MLHSVECAHTYAHSFPGYKIIADSLWEHAANAFQSIQRAKQTLFSDKSQLSLFSTQFYSQEHDRIFCPTSLLPPGMDHFILHLDNLFSTLTLFPCHFISRNLFLRSRTAPLNHSRP